MLFAIIQFFFVSNYETDKTILSSQIIDSMDRDFRLFGQNIPCSSWGTTPSGENLKWAEEPPLYHVIGVVFNKLGLRSINYKFMAFISYLGLIIGLLLNFNLLTINVKSLPLKTLAIVSMPFVMIHAHRPLPDNMSVMFLSFFLYFFLKKNKPIAFVFATLAVTTKALAIFAIFSVCLGELFAYKKQWKENFFKNLLFALSVIPMLLWLYYLKENSIPNPFFADSLGVQHSGGMNFVDLTTRKYYSRIFSWTAVRGVGVFIFVLSIFTAIKMKVKEPQMKILIWGILGQILYIVIVRGPQRAAPWYSFYFLPFYFLVFAYWSNLVGKKWFSAIVIINLISSLSFLRYTTEFEENLFKQTPKHAGIPCDFHKYIYEKHKKEGRL